MHLSSVVLPLSGVAAQSAGPSGGCCYGAPDERPNANSYTDALVCLTADYGTFTDQNGVTSCVGCLNPFTTTQAQCNDAGTNGCTRIGSSDRQVYCPTWSDTCPWSRMSTHWTCDGCTEDACAANSEGISPLMIIVPVALVILIPLVLFYKCRKMQAKKADSGGVTMSSIN